MLGVKFTHVLKSAAFYDVGFHWFKTRYNTNPGQIRDTSNVFRFGNSYLVNEAPFGFPSPFTPVISGIGSRMNMDLGWSGSRDTTVVAIFNFKADITSQLDRYNQVQAGLEFAYTDNNVNYANRDERLTSSNTRSVWHTFPKQGAAYLQDKIEFEGMITNVGLRLDYSHAGGK